MYEYEYEYNEHIMGTDLSVSIVTESEALADEIFTITFTRLREFEAQFSRFIPESELSRLNRERSCTVSPLFIILLHRARELYLKTDGYFNPLLQIDRFGYIKSFDEMENSDLELMILPYNTNLNTVIINEQARTVTLSEDQKLDFGGFLKGYLAEQEARRITNEHPEVTGVIVNIGGDIHTRGYDEHGKIFIFNIHNPLSTSDITVPLLNTSLATSGTYKRKWNIGSMPIHHILARDGVGNPKSDIISASVIHKDGAAAEAYAKALLTIDPNTLTTMVGETFLYILIHSDGTIHSSL